MINTSISGPASLTFLSNGRVSGASQVQFAITSTNASGARCVKLDLGGRPYQQSTAC